MAAAARRDCSGDKAWLQRGANDRNGGVARLESGGGWLQRGRGEGLCASGRGAAWQASETMPSDAKSAASSPPPPTSLPHPAPAPAQPPPEPASSAAMAAGESASRAKKDPGRLPVGQAVT